MPAPSSFETARSIVKGCKQTKLVFLAMQENKEYVVQALQAGAAGYLLKDTPAWKLISSLREVHQGGRCLSPELLGKLVDDFRSREDSHVRQRNSTLTPREREIMKLLAEGNTVRSIAGILAVSLKAVEAHKLNLSRNLAN